MKLETMIAKVREAGYHVKPRRETVGRPRSEGPRCACGEMTLARAKARGHRCATEPASAIEKGRLPQ